MKRLEVSPAAPIIVSLADGVVDPIPTLPLEAMLNHCALDDEATVKRLSALPAVPVIPTLEEGVDEPIPILPLEATLRNEVLDDDATLKMSFVEPDTPRTLKATVDDVALIPATVPLSRRIELPIVVADNQRVAKPDEPPDTVAVILSDDVDTQRVEVPVV